MLGRGRAILALLVLSLLSLGLASGPMSSPAGAQEAVSAQGRLFDDFGRLSLAWAAPPKIKIALEGQRLMLYFDRPASLRAEDVRAELKAYIRRASLSADGRMLTLELKKPVTYRSIVKGTRFDLDLAQPGEAVFPNGQAESAPAPSLAKAEAAPLPQPENAPRLKMRVGEHEGFSRLAVDWPAETGFRVERNGDTATITFQGPGRVNVAQILKDPPVRLRDMSAGSTGAGDLVLKLTLRPGVTVRAFANDNTVAIDLADGQQVASAEAGAQPMPAPTLQPTEPMGALTDLSPAPDEPSAPDVTGQQPAPELAPSLQIAAPEIAQPVVVTTESMAPPTSPPPPVKISARVAATGQGIVLSFTLAKKTGLALFKRGEALWLVLDRPGPLDIEALRQAAPALAGLARVETPFATVLRLPGIGAMGASARGDGRNWRVTLAADQAQRPAHDIEQRRESMGDGSGASLLLQTPRPGPVIALVDPELSDRLFVTGVLAAGLGVADESVWPDFRVLPSLQGIVIAPLSDRTRVAALPNGIVVTTQAQEAPAGQPAAPQTIAETAPPPANGQASPDQEGAASPGAPAPDVAVAEDELSVPGAGSVMGLQIEEGIFDLPRWRRGGEDSFSIDEQLLRMARSEAQGKAKSEAQLAIAQFYFANGRIPEALSELTDLAPLAEKGDRDVLALRGAALALMDRAVEAIADLDRPELKGIPEVNLFRGLTAARKGDWVGATEFFHRPLPHIDDYAKTSRMLIRRLAAEALIQAGDPLWAINFLDPIRIDQPGKDDRDHLSYLAGLRQLKFGNKEKAEIAWRRLGESPVNEVRAKSQFDLAELLLAEGKIDARSAAAEIEKIRFLWRGNAFEFHLLRRLGQIYLAADQPRRGLIALRQAATHFPENPEAKSITDEMSAAFRSLYLDGQADRLPLLSAVGLYDEFRELTPSGADGDRMITNLADRLIQVDLLDGAGRLLDYQVKKRLAGMDKAKAGMRLAAVRLLDGQPDAALEALKESDISGMAPEMAAERRRLQARAQFEVGDTLQALALIRDDSSLDGLHLKADFNWRLREWPAAAAALADVIAAEERTLAMPAAAMQPSIVDAAKDPAAVLLQAEDAGAPTVAQEKIFAERLAPLVLNRAVALSLAGDRRQLKALGKAYDARMKTTPYAQTFAALAVYDRGLAESISAELKSVNQLGALVDEYRQRLRQLSLGNSETTAALPAETPTQAAVPAP